MESKTADIVETNAEMNSKTQSGESKTSRPSIAFPAVVACGYREVRIPKSGNSFPAFLIAFPDDQAENENNDPDGCTTDTDGKTGRIRFAWRSKRDFMLLARSAASQSLPKSSLKKVAESNAVPWRRFTASSSGNSDNNFLSDPKLPNRFSARMKKSLWQLDRFLQEIRTDAATMERAKTAWEEFCRPLDTEHVVTVKEFVPRATCSTRFANETNKNNETLARIESEDANRLPTISTDETTTSLAESSRLGQYFASEENSRRVVECALQKILPLYGNGSNHNILFIEPSCGHGDIVAALVEALKWHKIPPKSVFIQGYDIDNCAIQTCRKRQEFPRSTKFYESGSIDDVNNEKEYRILWDCSSFFETARQTCISAFDSAYDDNVVSKNETDHDKELLVCCLGGPPYTTGQGSGSSIQRDLPTRFVQHCRNEWKADVVTFLLPARYREGMQHNITDCTFTTRTDVTPVPTKHERSPAAKTPVASEIKSWICETEELKESTFFFRGTTQVTQPSIIQTFYSCG